MAERINFEFEEQEIELTDGTVLTLPARTKEINDKISELAKKAGIMNEYDFYKENLIALFGRDGFRKIAPEAEKTNLDYLSPVWHTAKELFMGQKNDADNKELEKKMEILEKVIPQADVINSFLTRVK